MSDARPLSAMDLPEPPEFDDSDWQECAERGDYRRIAFGWFKYVAQIANTISTIHPSGPCIVEISPLRWAVLAGLVRRGARLMLSNLFLASKRPLRDATSIIDRCIFETCVKLIWLAEGDEDQRLRRFLLESLRTDVYLKEEIEQAIAERGGTVLQIERRMLDSMARYVEAAGLTEADLRTRDRMPGLEQMLRDIRMSSLIYAINQRQGSHSVHGTWVNLLQSYLERDAAGRLLPTRAEPQMHFGQLVGTPRFMLFALRAFVLTVMTNCDERDNWLGMLEALHDELTKVEEKAVGAHFEPEAP